MVKRRRLAIDTFAPVVMLKAGARTRFRPLTARAQAQMLLEARALKVKPHKGRAKDLTRIEDLVSRLAPLAAPKG